MATLGACQAGIEQSPSGPRFKNCDEGSRDTSGFNQSARQTRTPRTITQEQRELRCALGRFGQFGVTGIRISERNIGVCDSLIELIGQRLAWNWFGQRAWPTT